MTAPGEHCAMSFVEVMNTQRQKPFAICWVSVTPACYKLSTIVFLDRSGCTQVDFGAVEERKKASTSAYTAAGEFPHTVRPICTSIMSRA